MAEGVVLTSDTSQGELRPDRVRTTNSTNVFGTDVQPWLPWGVMVTQYSS